LFGLISMMSPRFVVIGTHTPKALRLRPRRGAKSSERIHRFLTTPRAGTTPNSFV
jgi:hypothetical protein